jgi:hypothetical protein
MLTVYRYRLWFSVRVNINATLGKVYGTCRVVYRILYTFRIDTGCTIKQGVGYYCMLIPFLYSS